MLLRETTVTVVAITKAWTPCHGGKQKFILLYILLVHELAQEMFGECIWSVEELSKASTSEPVRQNVTQI